MVLGRYMLPQKMFEKKGREIVLSEQVNCQLQYLLVVHILITIASALDIMLSMNLSFLLEQISSSDGWLCFEAFLVVFELRTNHMAENITGTTMTGTIADRYKQASQ